MTAIGAAPPSAIRTRPRSGAAARPNDAITAQETVAVHLAGTIARDALVERLMAASSASLALLVAPAGYGKTTVLAEWALCDAREFAWVRLAPADDDPLELARSLARGLGLRDAARSARRRSLDNLVRTLEAAFEESQQPFVMVVDNADVLHNTESLTVLERLVDRAGPHAQIAIAARRQPRLPVARLRTERRLVELRTADLVLTRGELHDVAAAAGLPLNDGACEALARRTEGWPAGVYLAALALRDEESPRQALASFGGADRLVVDYVREEILAELPAEVIEFLARTSILARLSGPLCDHILERSDSAELLRDLSQMNVLVVPLDRTDSEYRYHRLLAESLRSELRLREPELEPELHMRASEWYEGHGERKLAIEHAMAAGAVDRAGALLWQATPELLGWAHAPELARLLSHFSREQIGSCLPLALSAASSQLVLGDGALARHWLAAAEAAPKPADPSLEAGLLILEAAFGDGDLAAVRRAAAQAYELAADDSAWRALACLMEGAALRLAGDGVAAKRRLEEGARRGAAVAPAVQVLCLGELALLADDEGEWDRADVRAAIARAQIERVGLADYPLSAAVFAASAAIDAHLSRPESAERAARQAKRLLQELTLFTPRYTVQCRIALALAALRLSETARARELLADAGRELSEMPDAKAAHASLRACRQQLDAASAARTENAEELTTAELRVLQYLPTHLSFPEIADELYVSRNTVKTHVRAVYRKLVATSRSEAVQHARAAGLLDLAA